MAERRRKSFAQATDDARRAEDDLIPKIDPPTGKPAARPRAGTPVLANEPRLHVVQLAESPAARDTAEPEAPAPSKGVKAAGKRSRRQFADVQVPEPGAPRIQRSMSLPGDLVQQMAHYCLGYAAAQGKTVEHSWLVDAALRSLPDDVPSVIALAKQFGATWRGERLIRNTYVVSPQALEVVDRWRDKVISVGHSPREVPVNDVYIAALSTWLTHMHKVLPSEEAP